MVEYWSVGFKRNEQFINFPVKRNLTNKPLPHFIKNPCLPTGRHYSIIPIFQYSNCERSELSSIGVADDEEIARALASISRLAPLSMPLSNS